jgi:chromosome segregation ATPase
MSENGESGGVLHALTLFGMRVGLLEDSDVPDKHADVLPSVSPTSMSSSSAGTPSQKIQDTILSAVLGGKESKIMRLVAAIQRLSTKVVDEREQVTMALEILGFTSQEVLSELQRAQGSALAAEEKKFAQEVLALLDTAIQGAEKDKERTVQQVTTLESQLATVANQLETAKRTLASLDATIGSKKAERTAQMQVFQASLTEVKTRLTSLAQQLSPLNSGG